MLSKIKKRRAIEAVKKRRKHPFSLKLLFRVT
jgi:hypothetical protein